MKQIWSYDLYPVNWLTCRLCPDRLSVCSSFHTIFTMIFSKASILLSLCRHVKFGLGLRQIVIKARIHFPTFFLLRRHRVLPFACLIARLGARPNSCLIHGLEGIVTWHSCVVKICLLSTILSCSTMTCSTPVVPSWCHLPFLYFPSSN